MQSIAIPENKVLAEMRPFRLLTKCSGSGFIPRKSGRKEESTEAVLPSWFLGSITGG
jgi:hypothetical protein